jgi:hypothetical protein
VEPVGSDDDASPFGDRPAAPAVAADPHDAGLHDDDLLDAEPLAQLGPGLDRGVNQQLVQHDSPRGARHRRVSVPGAPVMVAVPKSKA